MRAPDWLTARPAAHRGLHDAARGIIENMPGAAQAAVAGNFSIECDIQLTSDGEAMVHHDDTLGRLTEGSGALLQKTAAELKAIKFTATPERMMSLGDLCALVKGRVPLVIEVKSHFDGDRRLVKRMAEVLASYAGPAVGMSFDPDHVLGMRELMPTRPRGIVAERSYTETDWPQASPAQRRGMTHMRHFLRTQPELVAPDIQFHFLPVLVVDHGRTKMKKNGYSLHVCTLRPESRGTIRLRSKDPKEHPLIDANYLAERRDLDTLIRGVKIGRDILAQSEFDPYRADEFQPGASVKTDAEIEQWIRSHCETIYHPVGTCKMGPANDPMAVVDHRCRVHGLVGLRVVDASVMPTLVGGNTNAPTIMIAERVAAFMQEP